MRLRIRHHLSGERALPPALAQLVRYEHGSLKNSAGLRKIDIEAEMHEATLKVMTEILDPPSELCRFSSLHSLGHWHARHPERVGQIVDAFVRRHQNLRPHVIEYASRARLGSVL